MSGQVLKGLRILMPWWMRRLLLNIRAFIRYGLRRVVLKQELVKSLWIDSWADYFNAEPIAQRTAVLKEGLDPVSCALIDQTIMLYDRYVEMGKHSYTLPMNEAWCDQDAVDQSQYKKAKSTVLKIKHKFRGTAFFDPYLFFSQYGLRDLLQERSIDLSDKVVLDVGAFNGDTACLFRELFRPKQIYSFEPNGDAFNRLCKFININQLTQKIVPLRQGVGDCERSLYSDGMELVQVGSPGDEAVSIRTIDQEVSERGLEVGLIKMDIEGFETPAIQGALQTIRTQRPVLCICIYHRPQDFFELKPALDALKLGYKFMIRRSEMATPLADMVLIAY